MGTWTRDENFRKSNEILDGAVQNPLTWSFHNRAPDHPHPSLTSYWFDRHRPPTRRPTAHGA